MKNLLKKLIVVTIALCMTISGFGWNYNVVHAEKEEKVIGLVVHNLDDNYVSYLVDAFEKVVDELDGYKLTVLDSKGDVNTESQNITNLISMNAAGIILHCVDSNACDNYITQCNEAEIPIITTKTLYSSVQPNANIIMDSHDAGVAEAEGLVELMGEKGNVVILLGELGSEYTNERTAGNKEVFDKYEGINVVTEECANWSRAEAMTIIENLLQSGQQFNAIICNNDEMAIGAGLAVQGQGLDLDDYYIAGIDSTPEGLSAISDGILDVSVFDNVVNLANTAVDTLMKILNGEDVEATINLKCQVITKDNIDECQTVWDELLDK